jgi:molybdopterin converting factor small subunit
MVTITLMGQLQALDGERDLAYEIPEPITVRQLIQQQGENLRPVLDLMKQKKLLVTVNKRIASEDTRIRDGDAIKLVAHDGMGGSGLAPS